MDSWFATPANEAHPAMAALNWADYLIVAVIGVSAFLSILRGFVREAFALCGWIAGGWLALTFGPGGARLLEGHVAVPSLRYAIAGLVLFFSALIVAALIAHFFAAVVEKTGQSGTDRALGMVFGLARGGVIVTILVLLAHLTPLPEDPWWNESALIEPFERAAFELERFLPPELAGYLAP